MAENLSARDFFNRMLQGRLEKFGISPSLIDLDHLNMKIKSESIELITPNNTMLRIKDPAIIRAAKLADLEETLFENAYQKRKEVLLELFGKEVVYKGTNMTWLKFQMENAFVPMGDIEERLTRLNNEIQTNIEYLKQHATTAIYRFLAKRVPYVTFEAAVSNMSKKEIYELLAYVSMRSRPSVEFAERAGKTIVVPTDISALYTRTME